MSNTPNPDSSPRARHLWLVLFCLVLVLSACGGERKKEERITLLQGYDYGMGKKLVAERAGAGPCPDDADSLCRRQPFSLFKILWEQRFTFRNDSLVAVELRYRNTREVQSLVDKWLDGGYRYMPTLVSSDGRDFDILAMLKQYGKDMTRQAVQNFVKSTPLNATTTYFYGDFERKNQLLTGAKSHADILARAPRDFVAIEESVNDERISLKFHAPIAYRQDSRLPQKR